MREPKIGDYVKVWENFAGGIIGWIKKVQKLKYEYKPSSFYYLEIEERDKRDTIHHINAEIHEIKFL